MKTLFLQIRAAVFSTLIIAVVCCGMYPLIVTGVSKLLFREKADGSLIAAQNGVITGSSLIGQTFSLKK